MATTVQRSSNPEIQPPRVKEFDGPAQLVEAVNGIFEDDLDLVAIRGLASHSDLQDRFKLLSLDLNACRDEFLYMPPQINKLLYKCIPEFLEVDKLVAEYWQDHGYADYQPQTSSKDHKSATIFAGQVRRGGLPTAHVDFLKDIRENKTGTLVGPLSLSICIEGRGIYFGQRLENAPVTPDGKFDKDKFVKDGSYKNLPADLRSRVSQNQWDGVLFLNSPVPTIHKVLADDLRKAALFDYSVERTDSK